MFSEEEIVTNYTKWFRIVEKVCGEQVANALDGKFSTRIATCPAALVASSGGYPGGLVERLLTVAARAKSFNDFGDPKLLVKVALLHELGRIGTETDELYIPQDSDWHREKLGQNYKYNEACPKMALAHRTLYLLSTIACPLAREEWIAIATSQGMHLEENRFYGDCLPLLAVGLQAARALCVKHN